MQTKTIVLIMLLPVFIGCGTSSKKETGDIDKEIIVIPLSELLKKHEQYENKEISVSGLCIHTCRRSGKRLFLQEKNQSTYLLVTASGNISKFDSNLEGKEIVVNGILSRQSAREEAHHHEEEEEGCENEKRAMAFKLEATSIKTLNNPSKTN